MIIFSTQPHNHSKTSSDRSASSALESPAHEAAHHKNEKSLARAEWNRFFRPIAGALGAVLLAGVLTAGWLNHREDQSHLAATDYFKAQKAEQEELNAIALTMPKTEKPTAEKIDAEKKGGQNSKGAAETPKKPEPTASQLQAAQVAPVDLSQKFPNTLAALKKVSGLPGAGRAGFEARLHLAYLYNTHGSTPQDRDQAIQWLNSAVDLAPSGQDKAWALLLKAQLLSSASPNSSIATEADTLAIYEKVAKLADGRIKAEALLAQARYWKNHQNPTKASTLVDEILKLAPNSELSQEAESLRQVGTTGSAPPSAASGGKSS